MHGSPRSRRRFLPLLLSGFAVLAGLPRRAIANGGSAGTARGPHPEPRPGITAARVVKAEQIADAKIREIFAKVREIPQVVDGIRCNCDCADLEGFYSLLSCYEDKGMAQHCLICQGQATLAHELHAKGWSLNGIRTAIDAKFGG
jgi:hypothetical protein